MIEFLLDNFLCSADQENAEGFKVYQFTCQDHIKKLYEDKMKKTDKDLEKKFEPFLKKKYKLNVNENSDKKQDERR